MLKDFLCSASKFGALATIVLYSTFSANAERLASENFDYQTGDLLNQGSWIKYNANNNDDPIQLISEPLCYPGYQDEAIGLAASLTGPSTSIQQQRLQKELFDNDHAIVSGTAYFSFLVKFTALPTGDVYFFAPVQRASKAATGIAEGKSGSEYARVFACKGDADGKLKIGMSKNAASATVKSEDLELNTTYLVVVRYEVVEGTTNDIVTLWVNPAKGTSDPAGVLTTTTNADISTSMGFQGIELRQGTTGQKAGASLLIDAIRVADTYADLWDGESGGGDDPGPQPGTANISAPASVDFGYLYQFQSASQIIHVSAEGLSSDIQVSYPSGFTGASAISANDAMAGYDLAVSYKANTAGTIEGAITLSADGAESVSVTVKADVTKVTPYARFNFFNNLNDGDANVYQFQGKGTVSYIDASTGTFYAQDLYGAGARFAYPYHDSCPVSVGQRISNFYCMVYEKSFGAVTMLLLPAEYTLVGDGYTVEPVEVSLSELSRDAESYINTLVKVNDVSFTKAGEKFGTANTAITSGSASGFARSFASTNLIGTEIPASANWITGISTSASTAVITMRSTADLDAVTTPVGEPEINVSSELLVDANEYRAIGTTTAFGKITIEYANLPKAAEIWISGAGRAAFSADATTIPQGSGTLVVNVSYTPTTVGKHVASLYIDATPTQLSQGISLSARAYDPANMPSLTVDTSTLTPFSCQVDQTQAQTFSYTAKGNLDNGTIQIAQPHQGQFQLSTGLLMKDGTYNITITFAPKQSGTFTETVKLTSDLCEDISFTITGTATGDTPIEDTEGDPLTDATFSTANAHKLVIEDFQQAGANNKPLSIAGWTNAAVEGTRAFWAYTDADGNTAAKVTAYDSKATEDTDATMLLLSPALDYKNADEHILKFRIMGDFMAEGGTGLFQVLYIDPADNNTSTLVNSNNILDKVYIEPIDGLNIPASSDYNKEWTEYAIDLEGLDLADTFFIGFSYGALRGKNFSSVYYVDDFSWGRTDIPFIRTDIRSAEYIDKNGNRPNSIDINVRGLNLTGDIAVSTVGQHASNFTPHTKTLPAQGGTVNVKFASENAGEHQAYLKLAAEGAPDTYVALLADNNRPSAIGLIESSGIDIEGIYNLSGIRIADADTLQPGVYIVRRTDGTTAKIVVK